MKTTPHHLRRAPVLAVILGLLLTTLGCSAPDTAPAPSSPTWLPAGPSIESPDASMASLSTPGTHCFASAGDVAIAVARINAQLAIDIDHIRQARAVANAGGPLPPIANDHVAEAADPDTNHCVLISTYDYEDRYPLPTPPN